MEPQMSINCLYFFLQTHSQNMHALKLILLVKISSNLLFFFCKNIWTIVSFLYMHFPLYAAKTQTLSETNAQFVSWVMTKHINLIFSSESEGHFQWDASFSKKCFITCCDDNPALEGSREMEQRIWRIWYKCNACHFK